MTVLALKRFGVTGSFGCILGHSSHCSKQCSKLPKPAEVSIATSTRNYIASLNRLALTNIFLKSQIDVSFWLLL